MKKVIFWILFSIGGTLFPLSLGLYYDSIPMFMGWFSVTFLLAALFWFMSECIR